MRARVKLLWRALTRRREFERELDEELAFHLEARSADLLKQGMGPEAARRQARIELGQGEIHRDDCRRARGLAWFDVFAGDLRYAARGLLRNPGFSLTALLVLGIAVAANALLFALFNAYGLRAPPLADSGNWVTLEARDAREASLGLWTVDEASQLIANPPAGLRGLYSLREVRLPVTAELTRPVSAEAVSHNYFDLLGIVPARGRLFSAAAGTDERGSVVLSDLGWRRLLDSDPDVIGRELEIATHRFTVIGIAPPDFTGTTPIHALFWLLEPDYERLRPDESGGLLQVELSGFLAPGTSPGAAAAAFSARTQDINRQRDVDHQIASVLLEPRSGYLRAADRRDLFRACLPIVLAFALLMLVAAANLANLVLARFAARQRELAVRVSVGAPRRRLLTQLLTECLLLAALAAVIGLALARLLVWPLQAALFAFMGGFGIDLVEISIDAQVIAYGFGLSVLAALVFGGTPALLATAPWRGGTAQPDMAALQRGASSSRLRGALMVGQLAISVVLLVLASLIAGNARLVERTELGFDPARRIGVHPDRVTPGLYAALRDLPQVERVTLASRAPLMGTPSRASAMVDGRSEPVFVRAVDANYMDVFGLQVLRGRALSRADESGAAVAVISRRTAERLWPGANAVGRVLDLPPQDGLGAIPDGHVEVVGVVEDVVSTWFVSGLDSSAVYLPASIESPAIRSLILQTRDSSAATLEAITRACVRAVPEQNCELMPMLSAVRIQRLPFLIASRVAASLGWIALGISCIGLYGLVSYLVVQRRREIGVRLALGAQPGRVTSEMLSGALRQIVLGLLIGLPLAFAVSRFAASFIASLRSFDLVSFVLVPLGLAALSLCAAWLPARRSAAVPPTIALRDE